MSRVHEPYGSFSFVQTLSDLSSLGTFHLLSYKRHEMTVLKRTALYNQHVAMGGRMVPFAGYELPVQYPTGPNVEHEATRAAAGLFDIDHMVQHLALPLHGRLGRTDVHAAVDFHRIH